MYPGEIGGFPQALGALAPALQGGLGMQFPGMPQPGMQPQGMQPEDTRVGLNTGIPGYVIPRDINPNAGWGAPEQPVSDFPADGGQYDLQGNDLVTLITQIEGQLNRAKQERATMVARANNNEKSYNQEPYGPESLPYKGSLSVRIPAARARVDKVSSEIGSTFDRDGSPIFGGTPSTNSTADLANHVENFMHSVLSEAKAVNSYRLNTHRAYKLGTAFLVSEVFSRPVSKTQVNFAAQFDEGGEEETENVLVVRSVKPQDMYTLPMGVSDVKDCGFVGERFQMPRWTFNDYVADGFYNIPFDESGQPYRIMNGLVDQLHGMSEEWKRNGFQSSQVDDDPAGEVDMMRAWVRFRPPSGEARGDRRSRLYYCVFPMNNVRAMLRVKENPYQYLDRPPYVAMPAGLGDGTIYGESWMTLLQPLQMELDTLHMMHVESVKRAFGRFFLVKEGSMLAGMLRARAQAMPVDGDAHMNNAATLSRVYPDEWLETDDPAMDVKDFAFTDINPQFSYDENRIIAYMNSATIDDMPTAGSVRSVFELRNAAAQNAAKLKALIKAHAANTFKPHIEIVKAQAWQYLMRESELSPYVRLMRYGDVVVPITMTDFFTGVSLDPAGTTTSADETVALTTTASLMAEVLPIVTNMPGIVKDPIVAARELVKARVDALGFQRQSVLFGLTEPTPEDIQKGMMYSQILRSISSTGGGAQSPAGQGPTMLGADGGAVMGANLGQPGQVPQFTGDSQGGSMGGIAPQIAQMMGAPQGANAG